jgi:hypothetical protein
LIHPVTFVTRLRLDAALYEPAAPRQPSQRGRTRVKGARLPTLQQRLQHPDTLWNRVVVPWYDGTQRLLEIASDAAVWYHSGLPPVPIRWVLIRDPLAESQPQALLCTDPHVAPVQVIQWFVLRWQLEVTFQEVRTHLGVESQRQWSDLAIARTTPVLFGLFFLGHPGGPSPARGCSHLYPPHCLVPQALTYLLRCYCPRAPAAMALFGDFLYVALRI